MSEATSRTNTGSRAPSDSQRLQAAIRYHGIAFLLAVTGWGAADAWSQNTELAIAHAIALINALVAGYVIAVLFHEWGHFIGARLSGAYSPMVREPKGAFIFGFNFDKSTREQFIAMSAGGIGANWLLVLLVLLLVPIDSASRAALFAMVAAQAISVSVFEGPILSRVMNGTDPKASLDLGVSNGSGDRGKVWGYGAGILLWLIAI